jgi:hypothetical protein
MTPYEAPAVVEEALLTQVTGAPAPTGEIDPPA